MFEQTFVNKDKPRAYYLGARFTKEERDLIKKCAKKRKFSMSDLFRIAIKEELKEDLLETKALRTNTHM